MAQLTAIAIGHPYLRLDTLQERGHHRGSPRVGDDVADRRRTEQHPLPPALAADPRRGLIGADDRAGTHRIGDRRSGGHQWRLGTREDIGDRALADRQAEHFAHQPRETLEADRLGDVQMDDQRLDTGSERRAGFEAFRGRC
jgi:hypothetical protein